MAQHNTIPARTAGRSLCSQNADNTRVYRCFRRSLAGPDMVGRPTRSAFGIGGCLHTDVP